MLTIRNILRPILDVVDSDRVLRRGLIKTIRSHSYRRFQILRSLDGNELLARVLQDGVPFAAGKIGATEAKVYKAVKSHRFPIRNSLRREVRLHSGVFPNGDGDLLQFAEMYQDRLQLMSLIAVWYQAGEPELISSLTSKPSFTQLTSLEPYYFANPWSRNLTGKRVLIVSPFVKTIGNQYHQRRKSIWQNESILPEFSMMLLKFPHSVSLEPSRFPTWFDLLASFEKEMGRLDFDVALIGAGAATMPLAAHAKRLGKIGIGMGGSLQVMFGISGRRWDQLRFFRQHVNDSWTRPAADETPEAARLVENGAYW